MSRLLTDRDILSEALDQNQATYGGIAEAYDASSSSRGRHAKRWFRPALEGFSEAGVRTVLELGPADGNLTKLLSDKGFDVTAIDFVEAMCALTKRNAPRAKVIHDEFLDHEFEATFDAVVCSAFVHIFPRPWDVEVLIKVRELLSPCGIAYLATTLHDTVDAGYLPKAGLDSAVRYRVRHTQESFEALIGLSGLRVQNFYATDDRLSTEKTWGNWIVTGRAS